MRELKKKLGVDRLPRGESTTLTIPQLEHILQKLDEGVSYEDARAEAMSLQEETKVRKPQVRPSPRPKVEPEEERRQELEEKAEAEEADTSGEDLVEEEVSDDEKELMDEIYHTLTETDSGFETLARLVVSGMMDYFKAIMESLQQLENKVDQIKSSMPPAEIFQNLESLDKESLLNYLEYIRVPRETIERLSMKSADEIREEIRKLVR